MGPIHFPEKLVRNYRSNMQYLFKLIALLINYMEYVKARVKGKVIPGQALKVPRGWGSQKLRQSAHAGGRVVSLLHRSPFTDNLAEKFDMCSRFRYVARNTITNISVRAIAQEVRCRSLWPQRSWLDAVSGEAGRSAVDRVDRTDKLFTLFRSLLRF